MPATKVGGKKEYGLKTEKKNQCTQRIYIGVELWLPGAGGKGKWGDVVQGVQNFRYARCISSGDLK